MASKLSQEERDVALNTLDGWEYQTATDSITRAFKFADFVQAFEFMTKVAVIAERQNHHPDWTNVYDRVTITLTDYEAGGLSRRDIEFAKAIDALV